MASRRTSLGIFSQKSERRFEGAVGQASPERRHETLYRLGRGISFHEFKCFWDRLPLQNARIANYGYSAELLNLEPYRREEWQLLNFIAENGWTSTGSSRVTGLKEFSARGAARRAKSVRSNCRRCKPAWAALVRPGHYPTRRNDFSRQCGRHSASREFGSRTPRRLVA